jgi:hypothetical protein
VTLNDWSRPTVRCLTENVVVRLDEHDVVLSRAVCSSLSHSTPLRSIFRVDRAAARRRGPPARAPVLVIASWPLDAPPRPRAQPVHVTGLRTVPSLSIVAAGATVVAALR